MVPMPQQNLQITAVAPDPTLLDLPWDVPLAEWPDEVLAALPQGISRHVVRFVNHGGRVLAIKEIGETVAYREYALLRQLHRIEVPSVVPVGVITGRSAPDGDRLEAVLITEHLPFSLPYRALFSQDLRPDTATRLIDALAVLLVRLHLVGFYWGDVSLSNTLFRRDAETFAAYLVDAETGDMHRELLDEDVDEVSIGDALVERYQELWAALTISEAFDSEERWRVAARIERLNDLGFDVGELEITTDIDGTKVRIQPKVVDAGHHSRRLLRLTGLDVQENQARRMLNDLDSFRAATDRQNDQEQIVAHAWVRQVFRPTIDAVPREMRRKLEPAQLFHEILDHRWFISQQAQRDIPLPEAATSYVENVLRHRPDEDALLGLAPGEAEQQA
jgi:tRNA A-37 threonylcarbamoyl transferase component Bud32